MNLAEYILLAMRIITRLMGLLLTAIAFQFFLNALEALKLFTMTGGPSSPEPRYEIAP